MAEVFSLRLPTAQGAGLKKFSSVWANSDNALFGLSSVIVVKRFLLGYCCRFLLQQKLEEFRLTIWLA
jgi:hypothetical protein